MKALDTLAFVLLCAAGTACGSSSSEKTGTGSAKVDNASTDDCTTDDNGDCIDDGSGDTGGGDDSSGDPYPTATGGDCQVGDTRVVDDSFPSASANCRESDGTVSIKNGPATRQKQYQCIQDPTSGQIGWVQSNCLCYTTVDCSGQIMSDSCGYVAGTGWVATYCNAP